MKNGVEKMEKHGDQWKISFDNGVEEYSDFVCVACGGYPKDSMFDWLRSSTGHSIESPVPSLFTFNMPGNPITGLMGISTIAKIKIQGTKLEEEGPALITHWGLSGPAVLKLSARGAREFFGVNYRFTANVNWCPEFNEQSVKEKLREFRSGNAGQKVMSRNELKVPHRLWEYLCGISGVGETTRWAELTAASQNKLGKNMCAHELKVEGKTTFKEEFVTAGGVRLTEIDPATMESRLQRGLYFAGEILDVDGVTGGFNFQHAWTSGWVAASAISG
jgi:predicted Rossmann fold flavoprotein